MLRVVQMVKEVLVEVDPAQKLAYFKEWRHCGQNN